MDARKTNDLKPATAGRIVFNELGSGKIIQVVLPQKHDLKPLSLYSISGLG